MKAKKNARVIASLDCRSFTVEELALIDERAKDGRCSRGEMLVRLLRTGLEAANSVEGGGHESV